ncbi:LamG domain-containing protein [Candidatus Poribacteria bacterium]|nr:LamG domain-containing protein [Candidatus Poribacteria bacterium]
MKNLFPVLAIIVLMTSFAYAADPTDDSLILYFSFDELNGDTVTDHSQYGNDGTLAGAPELAAGKFGNALKLNGESDWVEVPHADILTVETNVTVMAWINAERHMGPNEQRWQGILSKGNSPRSYSFYTESPSECLHLSAGGSGSVCTGKIALNEWQHVAAHVEDGTHRYWLNGENVGEFDGKNALPGAADTSSVFVGKTPESNREFLGLLDEVRIWNRALNEEEIQAEMNSATTPVEPLGKLSTTWAALKSKR